MHTVFGRILRLHQFHKNIFNRIIQRILSYSSKSTLNLDISAHYSVVTCVSGSQDMFSNSANKLIIRVAQF